MKLLRSSLTILKKDLKSEIRNRYAVNSLLMFVIVIITIIKFSLGKEIITPEILCGLLWIAIYFTSSSALARVFIKEEEKETSTALKVSTNHTQIFIGKLLFNFSLTFSLNIVILILFSIITEFTIKNPIGFLLIFFLGNSGMVISSTIIAAIISKANVKGTLYPVLSFPVLLPLLISVISATKLSVNGSVIQDFLPDIQIMFSYCIVILTLSLMVFKYIWED
ncbi:MAG: heme exporter protein CcmB [Ignavibacteria bacterium]|nr:heme exporter protein CcmB [Ignavibacteria bacterium]